MKEDKEMSMSELIVVDEVGMNQTSVTVQELASLKINQGLCTGTVGKEPKHKTLPIIGQMI